MHAETYIPGEGHSPGFFRDRMTLYFQTTKGFYRSIKEIIVKREYSFWEWWCGMHKKEKLLLAAFWQGLWVQGLHPYVDRSICFRSSDFLRFSVTIKIFGPQLYL